MKMIYKIIFLLIGTFLFAGTPNWKYNPGNYEFTSWIIGGEVLSDGENVAAEGDMFAAYDADGIIRGVAVQKDGFSTTEGQILYEMTIGSNDAGEQISFQYYDASEDDIFTIDETYTFSTNQQQGSLVEPVSYNTGDVFPIVLSFSNATKSSIDINYNSNVEIAGFQFDVAGVTIESASGGATASNGLSISTSTSAVLAFSITASTIPSGSGILLSLDFNDIVDSATLEVSKVVISGSSGTPIISSAVGSINLGISFSFNTSTLQAFYYFTTVTINGNNLDADDWVGAFNGDVCVGARLWDTSKCGGAVCEVPVMGYYTTLPEETAGYMTFGDVPTFKIYDASEDAYYDATSSEDIPSWANQGAFILDELSASGITISGCMDNGLLNDSPYPGIEACNYDHMATEYDGSCYYSCIGCMDNDACNYNSSFTVDCSDCCVSPPINYDCDGNCTNMDCADECGGSATEDNCEVCDTDSTNDNTPLTGTCDCASTPNGLAVVDNCGTCDTNSSNDCVQDCANDWGGTLVNDACDVCGGDNTSCADCADTPNGLAVVDNCGTCDTNSSNDCVQDCAGTWGGTLVNDACDVCGGDNTTCVDCADTPNGSAVVDNCGTCDTNSSNDCVQDCAGTWGGTLVNDACDVCGGDGTTCDNCASDFPTTPCGTYPTCSVIPDGKCDCDGNVEDCDDVCGGLAVIDECDICGGSDDNGNGECDVECDATGDNLNAHGLDCTGECGGLAKVDECDKCEGDNSTCTDCNGVVNGDEVYDNCGILCDINNLLPDCSIYCDNDLSNDCVQDCAGDWGGIKELDLCDVCGGDGTTCDDCASDFPTTPCGTYPACSVIPDGKCDCDGNVEDCVDVCGGLADIDLCDVCTGNAGYVSGTCNDCNGVAGGSAVLDNCGTCDTNSSNDCVQDCAGDWGGNKELDLCDVCGGDGTTCDDCASDFPTTPCGTYPACSVIPDGKCDCDGNVLDVCELCGGNGIPKGECNCYGDGPKENYDCDGNCTAELDCEYTCGGTVGPDFECPDGSFVCDPNGCDLDIQPHLLPDKFGINKIFPNPFNPITQIQYEISEYAFIKVRIFDIRGRKVAQLMNEHQNPGQHHINWDAGNHASGMYIVEMVIRSGDNASIFRDIRKILYMK